MPSYSLSSLACLHLLQHHRLLTDVLDLLHHIQLLIHVTLISLKHYHVLVHSAVTLLVGASRYIGHLSELCPFLAVIDLGTEQVVRTIATTVLEGLTSDGSRLLGSSGNQVFEVDLTL